MQDIEARSKGIKQRPKFISAGSGVRPVGKQQMLIVKLLHTAVVRQITQQNDGTVRFPEQAGIRIFQQDSRFPCQLLCKGESLLGSSKIDRDVFPERSVF